MFALYLENRESFRLQALQFLKYECGISFEAAKRVLDMERPRLLTGGYSQLVAVKNKFEANGAQIAIEYYPEGIDVASWISPSLSMDQKHCVKCGSSLFIAVPGLTTKEQIREFGEACQLPNSAEITRTGWIHPGVYCPNGCNFVLVELNEDFLPQRQNEPKAGS